MSAVRAGGTGGSGRFDGRVAVVTGAGTGIGAATCRRIVGEGGKVVLTGRREGPLREVAEPLGESALVVAGDAADADDVRRVLKGAVDAFGTVTSIVANAGGHRMGSAAEADDEAWQYTVRTNLDTAFVTIRESLPLLTANQGSAVIVSSIAGLFAGPGVVGYVTTKHALIGLTRSVARDFGRAGVRVNAVCPGWVETPMADSQMDDLAQIHSLADRASAYRLATKNVPLQRAATSDEIASVIAFLLSDDASAMTGSVVVADCGATCVDLPTVDFVV